MMIGNCNGDTLFCIDINECAGYNDCHQFCNNTIGSYFCSCWEGFHLETNNKTCAGMYH